MDGSGGSAPWYAHRSVRLVAADLSAACGYALVFLSPSRVEPSLRGWVLVGTLLIVVAPLPLRRFRPRTVFGVVLLGNLVAVGLGAVRDPLLAAAFALYPVALAAPPLGRPALLRSGSATLALLLLATVSGGIGGTGPTVRTAVLGALALGGSWVLGRAVAGRRAQAARATAEAARRAVTEERLRLARELHDVVSGTLGVIAIHASVGRHLSDREPQRAVEALGLIETASQEAVAEMRQLLDVLRTDGAAEDADEALDTRLLRLVDAARAAGVEAGAEFAGLETALPRPVDQAVHRIVQEGLANVIRHAGPTRCRVRVSVRTGSAEVEITDAGGAAPSRSSSGHGLTGMRERVAALDGTLAAEPVPGGGFRLLAAIPLNGRAASPLSESTASPLSERTASPLSERTASRLDGSAAS